MMRLLPIVLLAALWQAVAVSGLVDTDFLPSLTAVYHALADMVRGHEIVTNMAVSLFAAAAGLLLGVVLGVPLGAAMAMSPRVNGFFGPLVKATYSLPKTALVPLFILWMGVGSRTNITAVALASLLPIVIYTYHGIQGVPQILLWSARSMGTPERTLFRKILLPAAMDSILTGVRIALGFAFVLTVSSEMIASTAGMGNLMFMYGENGAYSYMYAAVGAVVIVAFLADRLLVWATGWLLRWQDPAQRGGAS